MNENVKMKLDDKVEVEWVTEMMVKGEMKPCKPRIRFNVIVFKNASRFDRQLYAEPIFDD